MRRGAAFAEILDEKLADFSAEEPKPAARAGFRTAPVLGFFYFPSSTDRGVRLQPDPVRLKADPTTSHESAARARNDARPTPVFDRRVTVTRPVVRRTLSSAQQQALDCLASLGATLDADFTPDQLRAAFRSLAFQYHPDRHPHSTDAEKRRLALVFAQLHDAYTGLQSIPAAA